MAKTKKPEETHHQKKRYGRHKKHSHSYKKVYWPYIPMLVMLFVVLSFGSFQPLQLGRVLAAKTDITSLGLLKNSNQQRAKHNVAPLTENKILAQAAQDKVNDMIARNYWSHQTPDGEQPWIFIDDVSYSYQRAGENLAYGFVTSTATINGWMQSESHRENMLDPLYSEVGFGIAEAQNFQGQGTQTVVVAFYAAPHAAVQSAIEESTTPVEHQQQPVTFLGSITDGQATWLSFFVGTITGLTAGFMIARHGLRLKRILSSGEHFIMHHPLLDLSVTAIVVIGALLLRTSGFIG